MCVKVIENNRSRHGRADGVVGLMIGSPAVGDQIQSTVVFPPLIRSFKVTAANSRGWSTAPTDL